MHSTAKNGDVEIAYWIRGSGNETVLLVNGLGGSSNRWGTRFPELMAERFQIVLMDNRGTGDSTRPDEPWSLEDMASDCVAVLDDAALSRVHVLGISMGGMISQIIAAEHASRVDRLLLLSTHFGGLDVVQPSAETIAAILPPPGTAPADATRSAMRAITAPGFADVHPEVIESLVDGSLDKPIRFQHLMFQKQAILDGDRTEQVPKIQAPTLVVHGDEDPLVPIENGRRLAAAIPSSRFVVLDGVGHVPMRECPDRLAEVAIGFFAERD